MHYEFTKNRDTTQYCSSLIKLFIHAYFLQKLSYFVLRIPPQAKTTGEGRSIPG